MAHKELSHSKYRHPNELNVGNGTRVWLRLSTHKTTVCATSAAFLLFIPLIAKLITRSGLVLSRIKTIVVTYIVGQANY
jgi:hypothetical protein